MSGLSLSVCYVGSKNQPKYQRLRQWVKNQKPVVFGLPVGSGTFTPDNHHDAQIELMKKKSIQFDQAAKREAAKLKRQEQAERKRAEAAKAAREAELAQMDPNERRKARMKDREEARKRAEEPTGVDEDVDKVPCYLSTVSISTYVTSVVNNGMLRQVTLPQTRAHDNPTITQDIEYITRLGGRNERISLDTYEPDDNGLISFTRHVGDRFNYPTKWGCMFSAISTAVGDRTFCSPMDYLTGHVTVQMESLRDFLKEKTKRFR